MPAIITLEGIDEALSHLQFKNPNALKSKLIKAIRSYYSEDLSIEKVRLIDADRLVRVLWPHETDDRVVKNKRRNLSSLRSSINMELDKLFQEGKNAEGVTIGQAYTFEMSNEAKDTILDRFSLQAGENSPFTMSRIMNVLNIVHDILEKLDSLSDAEEEPESKLEEIRDLIKNISEQVGLKGEKEVDVVEEVDDEEELEEILEDDVEAGDIEGLEDEEEVEELEDEEEDAAEDEVVELAEDEDLVEDDLEEVDVVEELVEARERARQFDDYLAEMDRVYNQYVPVSGGLYTIGSRQPKRDELLANEIRVASFYISKFPVTNALFEVFVEKTGYKTAAEKRGYGMVCEGRYHRIVDEETGLATVNWNSALTSRMVEGACWYQPLGPGSTLHKKRNHPVVQVSWEDAMAFAAWTGKRLPSEKEWEAAARTKNGSPFPWGKKWKRDGCNIDESYIGGTTAVDHYIQQANRLGLVDTLGNVLEWTTDVAEEKSNGQGGSKYYIAKGGSFISGQDIRLYSRFALESTSSSNILGFRCLSL